MFIGRLAHLRRLEHDFRQLTESLLLLLNQELGVTDNVDKQDMPDLEFFVWRVLRRHDATYLDAVGVSETIVRRRPTQLALNHDSRMRFDHDLARKSACVTASRGIAHHLMWEYVGAHF